MRRFAPLLLCLPILAGCAGESGWVNPASPKDRSGADLSACRHEADDDLGPSAYVEPGDERNSDPMKMVDRTRNAKRFEALVAACMGEKGYRRTKP
ncbi:MAG TPA: hypothetical protein VN809_13835 [Telmatospirillum sp.]|nr:hypothetical protein [Telmatospirillum sp.]